MGDLGQLGRVILIGGAILVAVGLVLVALARLLPGGRPVTCFVPLATSLLLSVLLTILLNLWARR
jgi:hypothetical protein